MYRISWKLWVLLLLPVCVASQINIQVGYGISMVNPKENERLINDYLIENQWIANKGSGLKILHGLDLGLKHSWSPMALGLIWKNRAGKLEFEGLSPVSGNLFKQQLYYSLNSFSMFLETNGRYLGLGASLDWNVFNIKQRYTGLDSKIGVSSQSGLGNRFYLNLNFPATHAAQITLQISYHLPMEQFDVNPLANSILDSNSTSYSREFWKHFGIGLLISNGPQNH
ncbi:MAG: hypothetical protein IPM34_05155 [Saprospiraceae bacterium]|nr:hypothetical protein [Saprospiraceae bacterium]